MQFILDAVEIVFLLLLFVLAVPVLVLATEIGVAVLLGKHIRPAPTVTHERPSVAVVIPAHNESEGVLPTLRDVLGQLASGDRCLVVADNCDDDTGIVARSAGAEVIERYDPDQPGKGYALDFAIKHMRGDPPGIIIIVDADCRMPQGTLAGLACQVRNTGRPCQARYIMNLPSEPSVRHRIAGFAWTIKTYVRPLSLRVLNTPCGLMGTGMAFPWTVADKLELATSHIVEDALTGLQLATDGQGALFCPDFNVRSTFPTAGASMDSQSTRWEHGSLLILTQMVPGLMRKAMQSLDWRLFFLALDSLVPPLSALVLLISAYLVASLLIALMGSVLPFIAGVVVSLVLSASLYMAWIFYGRSFLRIEDIVKLPGYILYKAPRYLDFLRGKTSGWIRTGRD